MTIWRPELPESSDGNPLATKIGDLLWNFPYSRLSSTSYFIAWIMRPEVVLGLVLFYLGTPVLLKDFMDKIGFDSKQSRTFHWAVVIHNVLLAVYSFITVLYSWPIVFGHFAEYGAFETYCDPNKTLWHSGFGAWALVFYISKYYEFVDTWVLVFKGKEPSFLQIYHHAGIVTIMWGAVASQSAWLVFVVLLNSLIHTLMYTYFLLKTIYPKMQIKSAKYLTTAQIGQFFLGILCSAGVLFMGDACDSQSSRFSLACLHIYGYGLVALFMAFAKRKYKKS
eukprot:CAMPEP_0119011738 /NCGR_PEP_ID=MMETSP1176-20130426/5858_1 /TAXON_ID=265551 /ORGANISM="Synedropsis recta cf, Strain CCMP1620" /LENGTH=279 /DNA_ID=CAMNT_0006964597 /DNA_START=136 /DNA_END=975 /DNA_ORIENTATION=+